MTEHIARLLVEFRLANIDVVPPGWIDRLLAQCDIPYVEIWDVSHQMYESQVCDNPCSIEPNSHFSCKAKVPPFSSQSAVQIHSASAAICVLFEDWLEAEKHSSGAYFLADCIDSAVEQYSESWQQRMLRGSRTRVMNTFVPQDTLFHVDIYA